MSAGGTVAAGRTSRRGASPDPEPRARLVRPEAGRTTVPGRLLLAALGAAIMTHVVAALLLLEAPRVWPWMSPPPPAFPAPPTIEMVEDDAVAAGGAKAAAGAPATSAAKPDPAATTAAPTRAPPGAPLSTAAPTASDAELATPMPDHPQPQAAAAATPEQSQQQPEIDLDPTDGLGYGHQDDEHVIPARPDDRRANRMPAYPRAAGRRGEEGSVQMLVMIDAAGTVSRVEVAVSSGHPDLDQTATRAVSGWHFHPAIEHGRPVPTQMMQTFNFHILRPGEATR